MTLHVGDTKDVFIADSCHCVSWNINRVQYKWEQLKQWYKLNIVVRDKSRWYNKSADSCVIQVIASCI